MKKETTQCDRIIEYMKDNGSITPWEAMKELGCMRLASRIHELRMMGVGIIKEWVTDKNIYGEEIKYASYRLEDQK